MHTSTRFLSRAYKKKLSIAFSMQMYASYLTHYFVSSCNAVRVNSRYQEMWAGRMMRKWTKPQSIPQPYAASVSLQYWSRDRKAMKIQNTNVKRCSWHSVTVLEPFSWKPHVPSWLFQILSNTSAKTGIWGSIQEKSNIHLTGESPVPPELVDSKNLLLHLHLRKDRVSHV